MKKSDASPNPVAPQVPIFLLAKSGRPLVWNHERAKAVIGYSSGLLAVAAGRLLQERGIGQVEVLSVSTVDRLGQVVAQLARHDVRSMIWNYTGDASPREIVPLESIGW